MYLKKIYIASIDAKCHPATDSQPEIHSVTIQLPVLLLCGLMANTGTGELSGLPL